MKSQFRQVALIGKYHAAALGAGRGAPPVPTLEDIAQFLASQGCEVIVERETAAVAGITGYTDAGRSGHRRAVRPGPGGGRRRHHAGHRPAARAPRRAADRHQPGAAGFHHRHPAGQVPRRRCTPMLRGEYEEDHRSLMHARVMRDGDCVFDALAMNDVVVNRGATSGMVELRVEVDGHFVANQRADGLIIATPTGLDRLRAVGRRPAAASVRLRAGCWCRSRRTRLSNRPHRAAGRVGDHDRGGGRARRQRQFRHAVAGVAAARRPHHGAPLAAPGAIPASRAAGAISTPCARNCTGTRGILRWRLRRIALRDFVIVRELELDLAGGFTRADRRNRRRQVHPDRCAAAGAGLPGRRRRGARRRRARRTSAPNSTCRRRWRPGWKKPASKPATACCCAAASTARARAAAWINGSPATATQLRELGDQLVDIHGQHAWQSLTRPEAVRGLLDGYAGVNTAGPAAAVAALAAALRRRWPTPARRRIRCSANASACNGRSAEVDKLAPGDGGVGRAQRQPHAPVQRPGAARSRARRAAGTGRRRRRRR